MASGTSTTAKTTAGTSVPPTRRREGGFPAVRSGDILVAADLAGADVRLSLFLLYPRRPAAHRRGDRGAARPHPARSRRGRAAQGRDREGAEGLRDLARPRRVAEGARHRQGQRDQAPRRGRPRAGPRRGRRSTPRSPMPRSASRANKARALVQVQEIATETAGAVVARLIGVEVGRRRGQQGAGASRRVSERAVMWQDPEFWVVISFLLLHGHAAEGEGAGADDQGARRPRRRHPQGARRGPPPARGGAEALADYQKRQREAEDEAKAIIEQARREAEAMARREPRRAWPRGWSGAPGSPRTRSPAPRPRR